MVSPEHNNATIPHPNPRKKWQQDANFWQVDIFHQALTDQGASIISRDKRMPTKTLEYIPEKVL